MMDEFLYSKGYRVGTQIGKGGFAAVFQGIHLETNDNVAIKVIDKAYVRCNDLVDRVAEEIKIHSRLEHPSVVKLYEWFEDSDSVYLILELCENGELQKYMKARGRPFEESEAREIMSQVIEGFIYLHAQGIIHRDLSMANILITRDMKLKICDFGLAKQLSRPDERHLTLCGTPNFISPEVAMRSSHGLETDVWGLGILLYTLLVGKPPFDTEGVKSTLTKVVMTDYTIPSHLSPEAKDLISKLLKKVPHERIPLKSIKSHPFFMQQKNRSGKGSFASTDSGLYTMTTVSDSSQNTTDNQMFRRLERDYNLPQFEKQPIRRSHSTSSRHREPLAPIRENRSRQPSFDEKVSAPLGNSKFRARSEFNINSHEENTRNIENRIRDFRSSEPQNPAGVAPYNVSNSLCDRLYSEDLRASASDRVRSWEGSDRLAPRKPEYLRPRDSSAERLGDFPRRHDDSAGTPSYDRPFEPQDFGGYETEQSRPFKSPSYEKMPQGDSPLFRDNPRETGRPGYDSCNPSSGTGDLARIRSVDRLCTREDLGRKLSPDALNYRFGGGVHSHPVATSHLSCPGELPLTQLKKTNCSHLLSCPSNCAHFTSCTCHAQKPSCHSVDRAWTRDINQSVATNNSAPAAVQSSPAWTRPLDQVPESAGNSKIQTPPLSTARLKATKQRTKNVIMQILEGGEVCLEFIKDRKGLERVVDVCRISGDGLRVAIYQPNGNRGVTISDTPSPLPPGGADFIYSYENLPSKFWKKYEYASRFVMLVKAKTPKVTFYSQLAKCCLMENSPNNDFEVNFYEGSRIVKTQSGVTLTEPGQVAKLLPVNDPSKLAGESRRFYGHYLKCYDQCSRYEAVLEQLTQTTPDLFFFPVIFGRKPSQTGISRPADNKENLSPTMSSGIASGVNMPSFGTSLATAPGRNSFRKTVSAPDRKFPTRTKGINDVSVIAGYLGGKVKRAEVPGLGKIIEHGNGEIEVLFLDKYELTVSPNTAAIRVRRSGDSKPLSFPPNSTLPDDVEHRLSLVPKFVECLRKFPTGIR